MPFCQFLKFCIVGALGFGIDAILLTGLVNQHGFDPFFARILSISAAMTFTWVLNRNFTFMTDQKVSFSEWSRYGAVNMVGAAINYGVFCAVLISNVAISHVIAIAMGSIAGLVWNFAGSRMMVFNK